MNTKSKPLKIVFIMLMIAFIFSVSALIYYRKVNDGTKSRLGKLTAEQRYKQVLIESNFAKRRSAFFNLNGGLSSENDTKILFSTGENAIILQDPEALETIARKLETLVRDNADEKKRVEKFKIKASEFYAVRARSNRFEIHKINSKINEIDAEIQANQNEINKIEERNWLEKTKAILLDEYPKDAERAVDLNADNFRAIYDLTRFLQDKIGGYDKKVVIKNFEKVVELGNGKFEKDGDYLRANLNLTILYFQIGDEAKAKCYSSQTMEKYLARGTDDYEYLFGKDSDGSWSEPEFIEAVEKVNPNREMTHNACAKFQAGN